MTTRRGRVSPIRSSCPRERRERCAQRSRRGGFQAFCVFADVCAWDARVAGGPEPRHGIVGLRTGFPSRSSIRPGPSWDLRTGRASDRVRRAIFAEIASVCAIAAHNLCVRHCAAAETGVGGGEVAAKGGQKSVALTANESSLAGRVTEYRRNVIPVEARIENLVGP